MNSMWHSLFEEAYAFSPGQEIRYIVRNLTIYYPALNSLPLVPILRHITPVHAFPCYFFNIHLHIIFPAMPRPSI